MFSKRKKQTSVNENEEKNRKRMFSIQIGNFFLSANCDVFIYFVFVVVLVAESELVNE